MKEKKVRNKFLQVVSYILKGFSFLMVAGSLLFLTMFALVKLGDRIPGNPGGEISSVFNELPAYVPISIMFLLWGAISGLIFAYTLLLMSKLTSNVSRDIIFDRVNVKYLRRMTIASLITSFLSTSEGLIDITSLFLALTFFLFSIILSRAITIAEEQEFTV